MMMAKSQIWILALLLIVLIAVFSYSNISPDEPANEGLTGNESAANQINKTNTNQSMIIPLDKPPFISSGE